MFNFPRLVFLVWVAPLAVTGSFWTDSFVNLTTSKQLTFIVLSSYVFTYKKPNILLSFLLFPVCSLSVNAPCHVTHGVIGLGNHLSLIHPPFVLLSIGLLGHRTLYNQGRNRFEVYTWLIALVLGMWWASQEVLWGGFWNWDLVELALVIGTFLSLYIYHNQPHSWEQFRLFATGLFTYIIYNKMPFEESVHSFTDSIWYSIERFFLVLVLLGLWKTYRKITVLAILLLPLLKVGFNGTYISTKYVKYFCLVIISLVFFATTTSSFKHSKKYNYTNHHWFLYLLTALIGYLALTSSVSQQRLGRPSIIWYEGPCRLQRKTVTSYEFTTFCKVNYTWDVRKVNGVISWTLPSKRTTAWSLT